jgi:phosphatidylglycerol:prolipoprotein diacylglycerol transferase
MLALMFASPGAIALQIGPIAIRWYGLLIATAVLLGTTLAHREAVRRGLDPDKLLNVVVLAVLASLAGARLYYVAFNWSYYAGNPAKILAVWEGGLAIHGGLIAGALAVVLYCRSTGLPVAVTTDVFAPAIALGQAIGRWGNFFNQEAFGTPTMLPWRLYIDPYYRPAHLAGFEYFHPTFLYESLWNLAVFAVLWFGLRRGLESRPGALTLCYLALYSVGRFFIEGLRIDSLMLGPFRAAQIMSLLLLVGAVAGLVVLLTRRGAAPERA